MPPLRDYRRLWGDADSGPVCIRGIQNGGGVKIRFSPELRRGGEVLAAAKDLRLATVILWSFGGVAVVFGAARPLLIFGILAASHRVRDDSNNRQQRNGDAPGPAETPKSVHYNYR